MMNNQNNKNGGNNNPPFLYYIEDGKYVFTEQFHLNRGFCCGNGCRHCPFHPKHIKGNKKHNNEHQD